MKAKIFLTMLFVGLMTMGFDCVNDYLLSINITGVTGTYAINPGNSPSNLIFDASVTFTPSQYLDQSFGTFKSVRIYDIRVSTIGTYAGNVNGQVRVNGVTVLSYSGPWVSFNTAQSLATSPLLSRTPNGVSTLVNAILSRQNIVLRGVGSVSQLPVPSGLSIKVEVFGQVDAAP